MESRIDKVLQQVAAQNHVTVEEVRRGIQFAITAAMNSDDPVAKAYWQLLSRDGKTPTPKELIPLLANLCNP